MGISGLWTFLERDPKNFINYKLHNSRIVIDAENFASLCYRQSPSVQHYGGEYFDYKINIELFIKQFELCHIEAIFVFGGCHSEEGNKLDTLLKRVDKAVRKVDELICCASTNIDADDKSLVIDLTPRLCRYVLVETLKEHNVSLIVCEREADLPVVELAMYLNCPIVSGDSDFFIYRPPNNGSYIFISMISFRPENRNLVLNCSKCCSTDTCRYMPCTAFNTSGPFYALKPGIPPILAVILGNDTSSGLRFPSEINIAIRKNFSAASYNQKRIHALVDWISSFSDQSEKLLCIVLSLYNDNELDPIIELLCISIFEYIPDITISGHNLAYSLGLVSSSLRSSISEPFISFSSKEARSKKLHDAATFIKGALIHKLNSIVQYTHVERENQIQSSLFYRWPESLVKSFRTFKMWPGLSDILYTRNGMTLGVTIEDLQTPKSINTCSIKLRELHYGIMVGLENYLGVESKLCGLNGSALTEYSRHGHMQIGKDIILVKPIVFPYDSPPVSTFTSFFKDFLNIDIDKNIQAPELQGLSVLMCLWYRNSYYSRQLSTGFSSSSLGLAVLCCAIAAKCNYQFVKQKMSSSDNTDDHYDIIAKLAKFEYSKYQKPIYHIRDVHQFNEMQIIAAEFIHLVTILENVCPFYSSSGNKSESLEWTNTILTVPLMCLVFTSGRLVYWINQSLNMDTPNLRFQIARDKWLPFILLPNCRSDKNIVLALQNEMTSLVRLIDRYIEH